MRIKEWEKEIVFLHEIAEGVADRSYGIHVAQMAGLPAAVIARAEEVLATLEAEGGTRQARRNWPTICRDFDAQVPVAAKTLDPELEKLLAALKPDELSPKEALELFIKIKAA